MVIDLLNLFLVELQLLQCVHDLLIGEHALLFTGLNQII